MPEDRSKDEEKAAGEVSRRDFLRLGALAGAGAGAAGLAGATAANAQETPWRELLSDAALELEEATIAEMQAAMTRGGLTSLELVNRYLERIRTIDESGPTLNAVLEVNPDARRIAKALDKERKDSGPRGPLHGIPVMLKGNIDPADRLTTPAGSLA
ncbi:MAG: amidase family protein, partial [Thermoanaerobaculia bacterium]